MSDSGTMRRAAHRGATIGVVAGALLLLALLAIPIAATIQTVDLDALGVDQDRAVVEMPYVHPDGHVDYGHRAFAAILGTGPLPWRVVGRLMTTRPVDPVARRVYHWVAANRSRLPGGTAADGDHRAGDPQHPGALFGACPVRAAGGASRWCGGTAGPRGRHGPRRAGSAARCGC